MARKSLEDRVVEQLEEWGGDIDIALAHCSAEIVPLGTAARLATVEKQLAAVRRAVLNHPGGPESKLAAGA
jgi:hypothetical protein